MESCRGAAPHIASGARNVSTANANRRKFNLEMPIAAREGVGPASRARLMHPRSRGAASARGRSIDPTGARTHPEWTDSVGPLWKNRGMTDTRFETVFEDTDDLLSGVDVDEIGDVETLLMILFARPVEVNEVSYEGGTPSLEAIIHGNDGAIGSVYAFPLSIIELTRSCAETVDELGPYTPDGVDAEKTLDVPAMSDGELITALQQALGKVRLFSMLDGGD